MFLFPPHSCDPLVVFLLPDPGAGDEEGAGRDLGQEEDLDGHLNLYV